MKKQMTVDGMMCSMCETHVAEALRKVPGVKKASASKNKKLATVECDESVTDDMLLDAVNATGYEASNVREAEEKKGFHLFGK